MFQKGVSGNPKGRPKGAKDKLNQSIREMIIEALERAGGAQYLLEQAKKNPQIFCALVGKVLPTQIQGPDGQAVPIKVIQNNYLAMPAQTGQQRVLPAAHQRIELAPAAEPIPGVVVAPAPAGTVELVQGEVAADLPMEPTFACSTATLS